MPAGGQSRTAGWMCLAGALAVCATVRCRAPCKNPPGSSAGSVRWVAAPARARPPPS